jgi:hypothetical protein
MSRTDVDVEVRFPNSAGVYGLSYSHPVQGNDEDEVDDEYGSLKWFVIESSPEDKKNLAILRKYTWMIGRSDYKITSPPLILENLYFLHAEYNISVKVNIEKIVSMVEEIYRSRDRLGVVA